MSQKRSNKAKTELGDGSGITWYDDYDIGNEDIESISSEEEHGSEYDTYPRTRSKPIQEIWTDEEIRRDLESQPEAEGITKLLNCESYEELFKKEGSYGTILLLAVWLEKIASLKFFLDSGISPNVKDVKERSILHLAACRGNVESLKLLIDKGLPVDLWDEKHKITPLHCAASKGKLSCLKELIKRGADVNAGQQTKSPLFYAVQSLAINCVKELLENGAITNTIQVFSETPLHVAAALGSLEIMTLLVKHGAAIDIQCGGDRSTPLHLTAEDGDAKCTKLLVEAGASEFVVNNKKQTPLHLAALSQCPETMNLLLLKGSDPNASDIDGRTPLHSAIVKASRSCDCVRLLLSFGANVNQPDEFGYTPLHLSALNEFSNCTMLLINSGGDVTARTNGGISVLTFITRKTPDVIPRYISKFDNCIKLHDHEIGDVDCELKLDFRVLVPTVGNKETELLLNFIEVGHREILKHPLCETFLFLKWRRIRKFFLFSLFYHSLFVTAFTFYVMGVFLRDCYLPKPSEKICLVAGYVSVIGYFMIALNTLMLAKEIFQIVHSWFGYIRQWENWMQLLIIFCVFCCVQPTPNMKTVAHWQHHVAAIGIFLNWLELMMIVGRFPIFGLYVQMFKTVSINFIKFIAAYLCLLLAFALSFGVIFANYNSFKQLQWVLLKVIVMMSGELEYEDMFFDDKQPIQYEGTAQIMFIGFVVLITIILTNLMVGLAVSDIQGLQQSAGLDRLVRQAELVAHLESMLFSRLLHFMPKRLMTLLHKKSLLLKSEYRWAIYIKPNDPREERIPKDLIANIYKLVVEKKDKPKKRTRNYDYVLTTASDYSSPPLSRLSSSGSHTNFISHQNRSLKSQIIGINKEFHDYSRVFKKKIENLTNQIYNLQNNRNQSQI